MPLGAAFVKAAIAGFTKPAPRAGSRRERRSYGQLRRTIAWPAETEFMSAPSRYWLTDLVLDNPVFIRAAMPRVMRRARHEVRGVLLCLPLGVSVLLGIYLRSVTSEDAAGIIGIIAAWAWAGLTVIVAALESSRSIGQERLQGTWEMLVLTRLGGGAIVTGKLLGALVPLWYVGAALLPFCLVLLYSTADLAWAYILLGVYALAIIGGTAAASIGLCCSLLFRTILSAQLATVTAGWVATNVVPGLLLLPFGLIYGDGSGALYYALFAVIALAPGYIALALLLTRFDHLDRRFREARG